MTAYEKVVLITRETRLEGLIERFNTRAQAEFYIEHSGGDFAMYVREHNRYHSALSLLRHYLSQLTKVQIVDRSFLPNFIFAATDLVVTIGIDGLVVNTAKYLEGQPIIAVNPDPAHIDGVLLPFDVDTAPAAVRRALTGETPVREVTMAEARLNDGQRLLAFNDLFIGVKSHVSARYRIQTGAREEHHSSSGIIVSTGAGSTGWLSSLFNMAQGMVSAFSSDVAPGGTAPTAAPLGYRPVDLRRAGALQEQDLRGEHRRGRDHAGYAPHPGIGDGGERGHLQ